MQGLQEKIKLVAIDLQNRPAWYKEKVYPENKVIPSLEPSNHHNNNDAIYLNQRIFLFSGEL